MKIFKKNETVEVIDVRYCKNKKCHCELRKSNQGDYCIDCQSKRDEKRDSFLAGAGLILAGAFTYIVKNNAKIVRVLLRK
ncbi:MAG: hypothetical protein Q8S15_06960 [Erysipelotrichaceae bacterium]|nr:hypothetical protein [Erysipelotrichaceae bacterium]